MPALSRTAGGEKLLRDLLKKNANKNVQGLACFYLAQNLQVQSEYATRQPTSRNAAELLTEAEEMFDRVIKDFADVKGEKGTLGEAAEPELFEIRFLSVGKTAPEITAEDIHGKKFNLSDYRGKVVLLDFWAHW